MSTIASPVVVGMGMACPLGLTSRAAVAALEAGISAISLSEFVRDEMGRDASYAGTSSLAPDLPRTQRVTSLVGSALRECLECCGELGGGRVACYLAIPEPGLGPPLDLRALATKLREVADFQVQPLGLELSKVFAHGRAGIFSALAEASHALSSGREQIVIIGGADSLVDHQTLRQLAADNRLLGRGNPGGLVPAEGAGFLILAQAKVFPASMRQAWVVGCENAVEDKPIEGSEASAADGLTSVFHRLRGGFSERIDEIFSAETGELFYGREFSYAYLRNAALMPEPLRVSGLGTTLGDAGAGAGAIALVRAISSLRPRRGPQNRSALAYGSSDGGFVGGCIVV